MERITEAEVCRANAIGACGGRPQKEAILIGVQHTGTTFFSRILEAVYGPYTPLKTPQGRFYYDHPTPHKAALIEERMKGRFLITTWRNKADTMASWIRRGVHELEDFHAQWDFWETVILPRAFVVSFEDKGTLAKLSRVLGVELKTDWKRVNASADAG